MPEVLAGNQRVQVGPEATAGTAVAATKILKELTKFDVHPKPQVRANRPLGQKFMGLFVPGREWTEASFEGEMGYNEFCYYLVAAFKALTPTGPGAQGEYTWAFTIDRLTQEVPKTLTVEHGSPDRAQQFAYGLIPSLGLKVTPDECTFNGTMLGRPIVDGFSLTGTLTSVPSVLITPGAWKIYIDATAGAIGTTQLTRPFMAELTFSDHWGQLFPIGGVSGHVEKPPSAQLKLTLEADAAGMALLSAIRAGSTQYIRLEAIGPIIGAAVTYKNTIDMAAACTDSPDYAEEQDAYAITWTFDLTYNAVFTKAFSMTLINMLAAVA